VDDLEYDAQSHRVLVSSRTNDQVFSIDPKTMTWKWWHTGYPIALIRPAGDRLVAASLDDGVVVEAVVSGQWSVVSGQWSVISGQWTALGFLLLAFQLSAFSSQLSALSS